MFPKMKETWIPILFNTTVARITGRPLPSEVATDYSDDDSADADQPTGNGKQNALQRRQAKEAAAAAAGPKKPKGPARGTEGAGKVGGRRRAGVPKKAEA